MILTDDRITEIFGIIDDLKNSFFNFRLYQEKVVPLRPK